MRVALGAALLAALAGVVALRLGDEEPTAQEGAEQAEPGALPAWSGRPRCAYPPPQPPPSAGEQLIGVHANLRYATPGSICTQLERVRSAGARLVREDFLWADIEPRPNRFRWRRWDALVESAARYGITLLPI